MQILIAIPCLLTGGTEMQTLSLVEALRGAGHEVSVVCYFEYSHAIVERAEEYGAEVLCLSASSGRVRGWCVVPFLFNALRRTVAKVKPDVVHVQYMAPGAIPCLIFKVLGIKNIIATIHTTADIYPNRWLIHLLQRYCLRAFTCITKRAEESFFGSSQLYTTQTRLDRHNHFTIYNALSSNISIRDSKRIFGSTTTIGVVSRLEQIKGMDLVIAAFAEIYASHRDVKLLVVGDGSLRNLMLSQAEELSVGSNIEWAGYQSQDALESYYDRIDILLMPSRSEGFGLTAIEGMARGCVVVASNIGGLPEVVRDEEVGLLHDSESIRGVVEGVERLLNNRGLLLKLSDNATRYVSRFHFNNYATLFNDLYKKL